MEKQAKIFSIINNKGGTGKTTLTLNLGAALARKRLKVLLIDLDSQCNLSTGLGLQTEKHVGQVLLRKASVADCMQKADGMMAIASVPELPDYEFHLNSEPGREFILRECLSEVQHRFDYILIDCPPSMGIASINSLVAAHYYLVPMQAENFAFLGLDRILEMAAKVKNRMNPQLDLGGIVMMRFDQRTRFAQAILQQLVSNPRLDAKLFDATIRRDISVMEAPAFRQSIFEYAPNSRGAADFKKLANELITRYGKT